MPRLAPAAACLMTALSLLLGACGDDAPPAADRPTTDAGDGSGADTTGSELDADPGAEFDAELPAEPTLPWPSPLDGSHQQWGIEVLERLPHDPDAFTQGLEYGTDGLWESTGQYGESTLRLLDPATGDVIEQRALDPDHFGEGLTLVDGDPVQLTWREGIAYRWGEELESADFVSYDGEGWGLCSSGDHLWMSDGTSTLTRRDPADFAVTATVEVTRNGESVSSLNELECIGDHVAANVWNTDEIVVIDPRTGVIGATIDASALQAEVQRLELGGVLNGIADRGDGTLLLGGKLWPTFFVVELSG